MALLVLVGATGCGSHDDVTGAKQSLVRLVLTVPPTAVTGESFQIDLEAQDIGLSNISNTRVEIVLPAPLEVDSVEPVGNTTATFANDAMGGEVTWIVGQLDVGAEARLHIHATGLLAPADSSRTATVVATLLADGVDSGDVVTSDSVTIHR